MFIIEKRDRNCSEEVCVMVCAHYICTRNNFFFHGIMAQERKSTVEHSFFLLLFYFIFYFFYIRVFVDFKTCKETCDYATWIFILLSLVAYVLVAEYILLLYFKFFFLANGMQCWPSAGDKMCRYIFPWRKKWPIIIDAYAVLGAWGQLAVPLTAIKYSNARMCCPHGAHSMRRQYGVNFSIVEKKSTHKIKTMIYMQDETKRRNAFKIDLGSWTH